jgi:hypothetical protein
MQTECLTNVDQMDTEYLLNDIRMLVYLLGDCDELHRAGHMDPGTFGAIVSLAAWRLESIATASVAQT